MDKLYLRPMLRLCRIVHRSNQRPRRQDDLGGAEKSNAQVKRNTSKKKADAVPANSQLAVLRALSIGLYLGFGRSPSKRDKSNHLLNQLPLPSDLSRTLCHSGSSRKACQLRPRPLGSGARGCRREFCLSEVRRWAFQYATFLIPCFSEELRGVFAKAPQQVVQFALVSV